MATLPGTPSDALPEVLATGSTDVRTIFVSMAAREPSGRDEAYIEWHSLDHRPEQYRLAGLRHSLRLASTPECRSARAVSDPRYDAVDHVMTYFFADRAALEPFGALGPALGRGGRMPLQLPSVEFAVYDLAGKIAASRSLAGADVMPWRPARGVYLIAEQGAASPAPLVDVRGVAGIWWHAGSVASIPFETDHRGLQLTYCYLDEDPVEVAERIRRPLETRWAETGVRPLLAAPFHTLVPFDWGRYLP
jgi:hypothetical protein